MNTQISHIEPDNPVPRPLPEWLETYGTAIISAALLAIGLWFDFGLKPVFFQGIARLIWYAVAYLPVAWPVLNLAVRRLSRKDAFNEFFLMTLATLGAFAIGEYPEAVGVMLFYRVGELFQDAAIDRAKGSIKALLSIQSDSVTVVDVQGKETVQHPRDVESGQIIRVKPGEKVALDGELLSDRISLNTAALTGESVPDTRQRGETVLAGMVNLESVADIKVTSAFADTKLAKILDLVEHAAARKAPTQLFMSRFAKIYTPVVVFLALGIVLLPFFFVHDYVFREWLYRALVFLVVSCPCGLIVSIPLGYFGGIGAASRHGILVKGANYLDLLTQIDTAVFDKTGTLTEGVFEVSEVKPTGQYSEKDLLNFALALESNSTHPVAKAVVRHAQNIVNLLPSVQVEEIPGHGLQGQVNGRTVVAGNTRLLKRLNITYPSDLDNEVGTLVAVAVDGQFAGYLTVSDRPKPDAANFVRELHKVGIRKVVVLSGDKQRVVDALAAGLGIDEARGDLLPEDKVRAVQKLQQEGRKVAFVGDGINDAPVITVADVGLAMGGLGSDAAIETADVVIQTDQPSRLATAIKIARVTKRTVWQNIGFAFVVKAIVLVLGAGGLATMWEAVFADVGVALLAILNAVRVQRTDY